MDHLHLVPPDLPAPVDDGACAGLVGTKLPKTQLLATDGSVVSLDAVTPSWLVLYVYPRTGRPGEALPAGWDLIPGARGCTPQACAYRDDHTRFERVEAEVLGLSAQPHDEQVEFVEREHLPFRLLSDPHLELAGLLGLPTFEVESSRLFKRVTLLAHAGVIEHVRYPVFPPDHDAEQVLTWLAEHARG